MTAVVMLIWSETEVEYLCNDDWTGQISLIRQGKLDFRRMSIRPLLVVRNAPSWFAVAGDGNCRGSDIQARRADQRWIIATDGVAQEVVETSPQRRGQLDAA
jgi:hypothetical protein